MDAKAKDLVVMMTRRELETLVIDCVKACLSGIEHNDTQAQFNKIYEKLCEIEDLCIDIKNKRNRQDA